MQQGRIYAVPFTGNPEVITDKDGNAAIEYYNADGTVITRW